MMNKTLLALLLVGASSQVQAGEWGYSGSLGPENWGEVAATCEQGKNQSPIDINSEQPSKLEKLEIRYQGAVSSLTNNGHTLQANVNGENHLLVDGDVFTLLQFHFHTPSENHIYGQSFPMEGHFVHKNSKGQLAVLAVMYKTGLTNKSLETLTEVLPSSHQEVSLESGVSVSELLPIDRSYYRFNGSLTTPPCSEGVRWFVFKHEVEANKATVAAMSDTMGENHRPIQPLNARIIVSN